MVYSAKLKRKRKIAFLSFIIILVTIFALIERLVLCHYDDIATQEGKKISAEILTNCISNVISRDDFSYENLVKISYNSSGEIISLETDADAVNKIQLELVKQINAQLSDTDINASEIPLGTLTDFPIFVGEGPRIKIKFSLNGSSQVELVSKFETGGLNQTIHRIYAHIETEVFSVSPIETSKITYSFDYLLCETVIVGQVPQYFSQIQRNI